VRHAITVVTSDEQRAEASPRLALLDGERVQVSRWYASTKQAQPSRLLDDQPSMLLRLLVAPLLAYRFYSLVQNTRLWSGKRPLILIRGRGFASRLAAYAGTWGGGDVVKADLTDEAPLGPTRFLLDEEGNLRFLEKN